MNLEVALPFALINATEFIYSLVVHGNYYSLYTVWLYMVTITVFCQTIGSIYEPMLALTNIIPRLLRAFQMKYITQLEKLERSLETRLELKAYICHIAS